MENDAVLTVLLLDVVDSGEPEGHVPSQEAQRHRQGQGAHHTLRVP